ncbi:MAG TPA: hypothetical protein VJB89_03465 [Candidatus Nanoarchaeia archaeon]|nr:hypothetical protein [Candidatus Nanoarchaeia archaeon]
MQKLRDTIYSKDYLEILIDEDQIDDFEAGFMYGYIDAFEETNDNLLFDGLCDLIN